MDGRRERIGPVIRKLDRRYFSNRTRCTPAVKVRAQQRPAHGSFAADCRWVKFSRAHP
jgi:hypothetical protein